MDTMTWKELGYSSGIAKISDLLKGDGDFYQEGVSLDFIIEQLIIGGWPTLLGVDAKNAIQLNSGYVDLLCEVDVGRVTAFFSKKYQYLS